MVSIIALPNKNKDDSQRMKKTSSIEYGYRNVVLMNECSHGHLCMGTVRLKYGKETQEEGKYKIVKIERSGYEINKSSQLSYSLGNLPQGLLPPEAVDESHN